MPLVEEARLLAKSHNLKYNRAVVRGHRADALWHWDQFIIWSNLYVRFA